MHCYEGVEVWHATRRNNLQDLQVCKSRKLQMQVIEGRNNGHRRPEMGPRPRLATPTPWGAGGH